MISENQDSKTEPASQATGWGFVLDKDYFGVLPHDTYHPIG
jgi:hypothetical protein